MQRQRKKCRSSGHIRTRKQHTTANSLASSSLVSLRSICNVSTDPAYKTSSPSYNRVYTTHGVQRSSLQHASHALQQRALRSVHLTQSSLQQLQDTSLLNAYITPTPELAMKQAAESDEQYLAPGKTPRSALEGIPISIKDNFNYAGVKTTAGSQFLETYISDYNATVVQRLRDGGAVIVGKTNLDEFGMGSHGTNSAYGPTLSSFQSPEAYHPSYGDDDSNTTKESEHNTTSRHLNRYTPGIYSPGGSSSGSAVSVSQYTAYASIGSDTGGSVRLPAAYTGNVGLKPTYGLISRHGLISYASSFDTPGIIARSAADARLVFDVIAGADPMDSTCILTPVKSRAPFMTPLPDPIDTTSDHCSQQYKCYTTTTDTPLKGLRVGIPESLMFSDISNEILEVWDLAASVLKKLGAEILTIPIDDLPTLEHALPSYYTLVQTEAVANLARYDGVRYGRTHYTNQPDYTPDFYTKIGEGEGNGSNDDLDTTPQHLDNNTPIRTPNRKQITSSLSDHDDSSGDTTSDLSSDDAHIDHHPLSKASVLQKLYSSNRQLFFGDEVKTRLLVGNFVSSSQSYESYVAKAMAIRQQISYELLSVLTPITKYNGDDDHPHTTNTSSSDQTQHNNRLGVDMLLFPSSTTPPLTFKQIDDLNKKDANTSYIDDVMTVIANLAGLPAISFPAATITKASHQTNEVISVNPPTKQSQSSESDASSTHVHLPVGMQLLGAPLTEDQLLQVVEAYQQYTRL